MAAIDPANCTISVLAEGPAKILKVVTPATADDGDTVDLSSYFESGFVAIVIGATDGAVNGTETAFDTTLTLPGSTDNEARTAICIGH